MESIQSIVAGILKHTKTLPSEEVPLMKSVGCIASKDIVASADFPSVTISLIDGFASRYEWLKKASKNSPVKLEIIENTALKSSTADGIAVPAKLFEQLPNGFDVVFGKGNVSISDQIVTITRPFEKWENILPSGSKIHKGDVVLSRGSEISYSDVGMASFLGLNSLPVIRKPQVALIFVCPSLGKVKNNETLNKYLKGISNTIAAQILKYSGLVKRYKILSDFSRTDRMTISRALKNDLIIFIGECSRENQDVFINALEKKNVHFQLQTKNVYPGSFFSFGTVGEKLIFLLPNDPVGAILNFEEFIRPALLKMRGRKQIRHNEVNARLGRAIYNSKGKISLIQAAVHLKNGIFYAIPIEKGQFTDMEKSRSVNGIIVLPEDVKQVPMGSVMRVQMLRQPDWNF